MRLRTFGWCALGATLALCACGGGGGGGGTPPPTSPPVVTENYTFPSGDATSSPGGTAWDIVGVTTKLSDQFHTANAYDTLEVDVTFAQDISTALPAPGQQLTGGGQLGVEVAIDVDGNPNTGVYGICNATNPLRPFEYLSDPGDDPSRLSDGNYSIIGPDGGPIYEGPSNPPAEAQTTISGNILKQIFYLVSLGVADGTSIPKIGVAAVSFNGLPHPTDCVPPGNGVEVFTT